MNLNGVSRSNPLRVKNPKAFQSVMDALSIECCWNDDGTVVITPQDAATWPSYDDASEQDIEFWQVVAEHLAEGTVAILQTAAGGGVCDFVGYAVAFTSDGQSVSLDLNEIHELARTAFGLTPARCEA
jgi:hypothetical protein